eukprot:CAMPEP_0181295164 /NCGR_PEP_ID=MMETSP1101-20121128/3996_1 /TAXON_ID=46948 /ORGANISM="Rhodomonas abbreviata, Strain Caron Lab Isolate" /LENGTH=48 /DNA_ID= /DNA_START= /DNA_END= /DNA_ORIENTATION=
MFGVVSNMFASKNAYEDASQQASSPIGFAGSNGISSATNVNAMGLMSS